MINDDILRLGLVLGGNTAQNFISNLRKIVKLVLFDNYDTLLNVNSIVSKISEQYLLEFSDKEVYESIRNDKGIIVHEDTDPVNNQYSLTPEEYQKLKEKQKTSIDVFVKQFLHENSFVDISFEDAKELIYRFLYFTFNSDAKTVLELLNRTETVKKDFCVSNEFTPNE